MNTLILQAISMMSSAHMNTMPTVYKAHFPKSRHKNVIRNKSKLLTNKHLRRFHTIKQPGFDVQRR